MRKAKKLIAGIMLACMFIAGTGVERADSADLPGNPDPGCL